MSPALKTVPLGPVAAAGGRETGRIRLSFEFFPPKTETMEENLWTAIRRLEPLGPDFVSVTYGAGGSTRERTHRTVRRILDETGLTPAAHLTCVGASRDEVDAVIRDYWEAGVRHVVAHDIDVLKAKVDAGATLAVSQFFFDLDAFLRFRDRVDAAGIKIPLVPGIMPVTNFNGLKKMSVACQTAIPAWLANLFEGLDDDADTRRLIACSVAAEMCAKLEEEGFDAFHFYTLNRADLVYAICRILGVREKGAAV